jgi:hypothetical protein
MPVGRVCDRCGAAFAGKPATLIEMTHRSERGTERDARLLCLDCTSSVVAFLQRRAEVLSPLEPVQPWAAVS